MTVRGCLSPSTAVTTESTISFQSYQTADCLEHADNDYRFFCYDLMLML